MLLEVRDIHVHYGQAAALRGISFSVESGDFITLFGSNGAGKSTCLRTISGLKSVSSGDIVFDGSNISSASADVILTSGIAQVPEGRRVFKDLTVTENLRLGAFTRKDKAVNDDLALMFKRFPRLKERKNQLARTMSGGEQQMVAIARALMSRPKLLLLDEPSLGLAPVIVEEIASILQEINQQGVTIILVEQNAEMALRVARYGYVIENGAITLQDPTDKLATNQHIRKAYLGI